MKILYKYMPFRLSFFDDPLLRLTPPSDLNDPFDSKETLKKTSISGEIHASHELNG